MANTTASSNVQLSLFPSQGTSVKDTQNGSNARVSNYLCTREALWCILATYPQDMTITEAIRRARIDFTRCKKGGAV